MTPQNDPTPGTSDSGRKRLSRRQTLKWMAAATATISMLEVSAHGQGAAAPLPGIVQLTIGTDPNLVNPVVPWERTLTEAQLRTVTTLCDLIIPADERSPAASAVGVPDFIDEWVSAPYPDQQRDREMIIEGLAWLDEESNRRFSKPFHQLDARQQTAIADDIKHLPDAKPPMEKAAQFFSKMRYLTAGAFYTTPQGMADVQYIGNVPLAEFPGPPPEVLQKLGLV